MAARLLMVMSTSDSGSLVVVMDNNVEHPPFGTVAFVGAVMFPNVLKTVTVNSGFGAT